MIPVHIELVTDNVLHQTQVVKCKGIFETELYDVEKCMERITEAIILSAGEGLRLWPITRETPKCLVRVKNKPLLYYQIEWLKKFGINKVIVTIRREHEKQVGEINQLGRTIVVLEDELLGTAGGVNHVLECDLIKGNSFLCLNADDITDINLQEVFNLPPPVICVAKGRFPFGVVKVKNDDVISFQEKPILSRWVNCGCSVLTKDIQFPQKGSLEYDVFPKLVKDKKLKVYKHKGFWITVNSQRDILVAEQEGK